MSYGLFRKEHLENVVLSGASKFSCQSCGLYKDALTTKMEPFGLFRKRILCCGEAPGAQEDKIGKPFQGKAGTRLQKEFNRLGYSLFGDCTCINSVNCRPPDNRAPKPNELACCRMQVVNPTIARLNPHTIILLGGIAIESILGQYWKKDLGTVSRWRGLTIPDQTLQAWICPIFHPSYVERESTRPEVTTIFRQDLARALDTSTRKFPKLGNPRDQVTLLHTEDEICTVLDRIVDGREGDLIAFDYETSGLKPQMEGHRVVCTSIATEKRTYAFMGPTTDDEVYCWKRLLTSKIKKVAHNLKFEDAWSKVIFGVDVRNWVWDSMLAAHVLDNRKGVTSLKFQTYLHFGVAGYDTAIEPYLEGIDKKCGNSTNRIDLAIQELGANEVLMYCGLDSLFTRKLAIQQMETIETAV